MTNVYGIEPESAGWLEQESPAMPDCPICHSAAEVYIADETVAVFSTEYTCATCGHTFFTVEAIPF